ncbi:MAG: glycosyltransferase family 2 protein [Candidatus Muirbacterium halophilum]|nr:glycosyltransferase family 2 protein [Candidatus Muirbacterium halophilum]MCK9475735.1 glycosyltransferase family 2 protein [Candidatus Muirbacterium halophilum]
MKELLTLVIPVYNEEKALNILIEKFVELEKMLNIIFVDDFSYDNSRLMLKEKDFNVISHPYNKGYGASLKTGIRNAKTPYICIMDADFQHRIEDLWKLTQYMNDFDTVIGARSSESHFPLFRRPGKFLINKFASYVAGFKIKDINSGLRIFKKNDIERFIDILPNGFSFTTTSTLLFIKSGYSIKYIPVTVEKRVGKSSVKIKDGIRTLLLILKTLMLFCPLKFFVPLSAFLLFSGFGFIGLEFYLYNIINVSTSALLLFISSLLVFLFGMISEQISQLKRITR